MEQNFWETVQIRKSPVYKTGFSIFMSQSKSQK
jgi:hypothetical protein